MRQDNETDLMGCLGIKIASKFIYIDFSCLWFSLVFVLVGWIVINKILLKTSLSGV
jgi:hypothetical protein